MLADQIEQLQAEIRNFQPGSLEELENPIPRTERGDYPTNGNL